METLEGLSKEEKGLTIMEVGCRAGVTIEELVRTSRIKIDKAIGLDGNPLPSLIPEDVLGGSAPVTQFLCGDPRKMPVESDSVDFAFSVDTLKYVPDALRALEEGFRVLKEGGTMLWFVNGKKDISTWPDLSSILINTPGVENVFETKKSEYGYGYSLVCTKPPKNEFVGFPYDAVREGPSLWYAMFPQTKEHYERRTVYARRGWGLDWLLKATGFK